jgi:D-3-phosphoglycerate dehydrogenase
MPRIIVLDDLSPEGLALLDQAVDVQYEVRTGLKGTPLHDALLEYDGAICRSGVKITADSLTGNRRLRAIVRAGVGTDNIDRVAATRQGIVVMNTPAGNTLSTAEHAFALILGLSRCLAPAHQSLREGRWDRKSFMGTQLANKTIGIVGMGRIGVEVARRAQAFQMHVIGYDPFLTADRAAQLGIDRAESVAEMLPQIDYLTVHTPLTPETTNLISMAELEVIKPGARLINCARGGIYDEAALVAGLQSGRLAGVALDVFVEEPCTTSPLFELPGVLCTPHLGASTEEAQTQVAIEAVHLLLNYLRTGEIRHAVNVASVDPTTLSLVRPYLEVAYRLGLLSAQWIQGPPTSCRLRYRGEVAQQDTKLLTSAFCAGLMERAMAGEVNIVNAEWLLSERGIQVTTESTVDRGAFNSTLMAEIQADQQTYVVEGTVFGNDMPRLIRLGSFRLEAYLDGELMIFTHRDVPGIIGAVGTIFGQHQVNIAQMSVGRSRATSGGEAVGVLNLDSDPPPAALEAVLRHPGIQSVRVIHLPPSGELPSWMPDRGRQR